MRVLIVLALNLAIGVGVDLLASQFVVFALSGYGVHSGIWHAFMIVVALSFVVGAVVRLSK
jgi:hypothetical protein